MAVVEVESAGPSAPCESSAEAVVTFGPSEHVTCEMIERIADGAGACYSGEARAAMVRSVGVLERAREAGEQIYGLTTGFGPHVCYRADEDANRQGSGLIAHLAAGWGALASRGTVRATMAARCQVLARGCSAISCEAADALLAVLNADVVPAVPEVGSVGASGDLIPLAHVARVLGGEGSVVADDGSTVDAREALAGAGLAPVELAARDALAIVNGTALMTAQAALGLARAERLLAHAERLTAWAYAQLGSRRQALDARLHAARGHAGQADSARCIREAIPRSCDEDPARPLQEVYSIRCAPQFLGACRDQLAYARRVIERELNGVSDNPVVWSAPGEEAVLHGGNFQGQQIAFASDAVNLAVTQIANLIERQLDVVLNPELNGGAPLLLAWTPGATSGLAGAQITATAMVADMRRGAVPSSVASLPTNGRNQDVVSMGTMASRVVGEQVDRLAGVLAIHAIALRQLAFLRECGRAPGPVVSPPAWCPPIDGLEEDRSLHEDIARVAAMFLRA